MDSLIVCVKEELPQKAFTDFGDTGKASKTLYPSTHKTSRGSIYVFLKRPVWAHVGQFHNTPRRCELYDEALLTEV